MRGTASMLRPGAKIVVRNEKGRIVTELPVAHVGPSCANHVHVQLKDGRNWCFDVGAAVEMS